MLASTFCIPRRIMIFVFIGFVSCAKTNISGQYLAKFNDGVGFLQLVETPDKHINGQFETVTLNPDGAVRTNSVHVTGAVDGENVTLTLGESSFLHSAATASGIFSAGKLTLAWPFSKNNQPTTTVFERSSQDQFNTQVSAINARASQIIKEKAAAHAIELEQRARDEEEQNERNFVVALEQLIAAMSEFRTKANAHVTRFPAVEQHFLRITAKMGDLLKQERQAVGRDASVQRGQLSVEISQGSVALEQLHNEVQAEESSFELARPLFEKVANAESKCKTIHDNSNLHNSEALNAQCAKFAEAVPTYRQTFAAMVRGLASIEGVYQQQHKLAEQIVQQSQRFQ